MIGSAAFSFGLAMIIYYFYEIGRLNELTDVIADCTRDPKCSDIQSVAQKDRDILLEWRRNLPIFVTIGITLLSGGTGVLSACLRALFGTVSGPQALAGAPAALALLYLWHVIKPSFAAFDILPIICVSVIGGLAVVEVLKYLDRFISGNSDDDDLEK